MANPQFSPPNIRDVGATALIANGESMSAAIDLTAHSLCAVKLPAAWTAAGLTFLADIDGTGTYGPLKYQGVEYEIPTVAAGDFITVNPAAFVGCRFLKVRSGTAAAAVNQGGARTLQLVVAPFF
jgi:hypothetical protein